MNEPAPTTVWYKIDPRRQSLGLILADSSSLFVILLRVVVLKLLRINPPATCGFQLDPPYRPIELEQMPASAEQTLRAMIDECAKHSFQLAYCHAADFLGDAEGYVAHLLHADGRVRCTASWIRAGKATESGCTFISRMRDGAIYSMSNLRRSIDVPRGIHDLTYPGASIEEIFSSHQKLLQKLGEEAAVSLTAEQLAEASNELRRRNLAFAIARGALKPMTPAEVERLTFVVAELVPEPSDNPFRSPREDAPARRSSTAWRSIGNGVCLGLLLGALVALWFGSGIERPPNATARETWLAILCFFGWLPFSVLAGAVFGWLAWRRAQRRSPRTPFSN